MLSRDSLTYKREVQVVKSAPERDQDLRYAAQMTNAQFSALALHLSQDKVRNELQVMLGDRRPHHGRLAEASEVRRWLLNGWNTELLLGANSRTLHEDGLRHSLHWAFPQAYYSAYALCVAFFRSVGMSEDSHSAVIRRFGSEVAAGKYPPALRVLAHGYPPSVSGVGPTGMRSTGDFDPNAPGTINGQMAQFLSATRKIDLKEKKSDFKLKTKTGAPRQKFRNEDWQIVSERLGYTSLLSLLYRKRIKANYRDIDTFLSTDIDVNQLYDDLKQIVASLNLVHEAFVAFALGVPLLDGALEALPGNEKAGPRQRIDLVRSILAK